MYSNKNSEIDLVLIRGLMSSSFHWHNFLPHLNSHFTNLLIHTPDIIGNGTKNKHLTPLCPKENVKGLKEQISSQNKKVLIGFSLGGMLAIEWARLHPDEIAGAILINSSLTGSPIWKRFTPWSFIRIMMAGLHNDFNKKEEKILRLTTQLKTNELSKIISEFAEIEFKYPTQSVNFMRQLYVATQISILNKKPDIPILIVNSRNDKIVHPTCSKKISADWNLELLEHEHAGHDLSLDDPQWLITHISNWLKSHGLTEKSTSIFKNSNCLQEETCKEQLRHL